MLRERPHRRLQAKPLAITTALRVLLKALEDTPAGSPAGAAAYTAAICRRGEELAAVGGSEALRAAHAAALDAAPDQNGARAAVLNAA